MKKAAKSKVTSITLEFEDNTPLPDIYGEHNAHLARIEEATGASFSPKGNILVIEGLPDACAGAKQIIVSLHETLSRVEGLSLADVEGAIRMANFLEAPEIKSVTNHNIAEREGLSLKANSIRTRNAIIAPRSVNQARYIQALRETDMTFGLGPAGTGKTFLAVAMAVSHLLEGRVERIVLTRPAVEAGEKLGFLPGDMREKVDPYLRPLYDALGQMISMEQTEKRLENGDIEVAPLAFMRGRTLSNAFVILDEAQNTSPMQMKMFLTRFGENCRMVVCGDPSQVDLPDGTPSGLKHALDTLGYIDEISFIEFNADDVVRHPLVGKIVRAYDKVER
ncbi:PhoH family protein [Paremcibacter congregatus]|uniref:PhoH-like protein n=1 Tax=Paremcibacter congregatus TaxID=2043170 RepID=A0A2G4YUJ8_9PROT|nr:PhoH family protein [Paremcibacter congregatus]PHZ86012.1 phosphate starvation-inducible protein PhoH [Paremcibacter congregatus]QDE26977.1 PhoH family protein [Paremcibacter congregatus]